MDLIVVLEAKKQFNHLPKIEQVKVKRKLVLLAENPYAGRKLSGEFEKLRSLRAWPYRILYSIDNVQQTIFVVSILHRQGAYN